MANSWRSIESFRGPDRHEVDVWMSVYASPHSFGLSDAFRVVEAYMVKGKWYHCYKGIEAELYAPYITHWMPIPEPPDNQK